MVRSALLLLGTLGMGPTAKTRPNPRWFAAAQAAQDLRLSSVERLPLGCWHSRVLLRLGQRRKSLWEPRCPLGRTVPNSQDQASCSLKVAPGSQILACSWPAGKSWWGETLPCPAHQQVFPFHRNHVCGPQASSRAQAPLTWWCTAVLMARATRKSLAAIFVSLVTP